MRRRAQDLQQDGYDVGELPADEGALMQSVLNDPTAKYNSADLNVAYKMSVNEYQRLCPFADALEANWGKPPGACRGARADGGALPALPSVPRRARQRARRCGDVIAPRGAARRAPAGQARAGR